MSRSFFALFVAILIHLIFLLLYLVTESFIPKIKEPLKPSERKIKISLKEMPKKHKDSGRKKAKLKPSTIAPPMPKGSQLKKIVKKPPIKYKPKKAIKKSISKIKKQNPKTKIEPMAQLKPFIPLVRAKKENNTTKEKIIKKGSVNPLYAILSQDRSSQEREVKKTKKSSSNNINQNIKELYGKEFGRLSAGQQEYILDNQEIMRRITQEVLNRQASVTNLNGLNVNTNNVIEFYLHPNGDMSDFKFLNKSGYFLLEDITKSTIDYAYSKYPRPKEKTLIRYNVFYNLR